MGTEVRRAGAARELYVGYLPLPRRHARLLWVLLPVLALGLGVVAGLLAGGQRDPGPGVWTLGGPSEWTGTLITAPYPMILVAEGGAERALLLVGVGKHGLPLAAGLGGGGAARVSGTLLRRGDAGMIEVIALDPAPGGNRTPPESPPQESVRLRGEVVDSKCFTGAMKPGDGKTHRSCATLCIDGGIPPGLAVWDEDGGARLIILRAPVAGSAAGLVRPYIGEGVEVEGSSETIGGLQIVTVRDIRRP